MTEHVIDEEEVVSLCVGVKHPCTSLFRKTLFPLQNKHLQHSPVQAECVSLRVVCKAACVSVSLHGGKNGVDLHMWLVSH